MSKQWKFPPLGEWRYNESYVWYESEEQGGRRYEIKQHGDTHWVAEVIHADGSVCRGSDVRSRPRDVLAELRRSRDFG